MSNRTPFEAQRDAARHTIRNAQGSAHVEPLPRGTDVSAYIAQRQVNATLAVAEAILTLAEAVRPAPVEVNVTVDVDEDQIAQSVREAMDGGAA